MIILSDLILGGGMLQRMMAEFAGQKIVIVEMGVAYGGEIEEIGRRLGAAGEVWGYDTFEGQPKQLAESGQALEAWCMDSWYAKLGRDKLTYEYIRGELDRQGLSNVHLIKGLVHPQSCADLPRIHCAILDLDIPASMEAGWQVVRDRVIPGGYVLIHDVFDGGIPNLNRWYHDGPRKDPGFEVHDESHAGTLAILRKR